MKKRSNGLFRPSDLIIIAIICIISVALLFSQNESKSDAVAVISVNGEEVERIDLSSCEDAVFTLDTTPTVTLEIKNSEIRFTDSLCPDGTCEKSGFLSKVGDTAACVPAKTVVSIEGKQSNSSLDAVAG